MQFSHFVNSAFHGDQHDGRHLYLQDDVRSFPELQHDCTLPESLQIKPISQSKLLVSPHASVTSLHYDPVETFLEQIEGRKRLLLFPPGVTAYYPHGWRTKAPFVSRVVNAADPDLLRFPRFAQAPRLEGFLEPGDVLYIPFGWWHEIHSLDRVNISVNHRWFASVPKTVSLLPQFLRAAPVIAKFLASRRRDGRAQPGPPGAAQTSNRVT